MPSSIRFTPITSSAFCIKIEGITDEGAEFFQSVEGLSISTELELVVEGGQSSYYHVPTKPQYANLVLQRPVLKEKSALSAWCEESIQAQQLKPIDVNVFCMAVEDGKILAQWSALGAIPMSLQISKISLSDKTELLSETITLSYSTLKRVYA